MNSLESQIKKGNIWKNSVVLSRIYTITSDKISDDVWCSVRMIENYIFNNIINFTTTLQNNINNNNE